MAAGTFIVDVRSDTKRIVAELRAEQQNVARAQARALNRTAEQVRTEAGREIRKEYNVTLRGIRQASRILRARISSRFPRAEVVFSGRSINLYEFGARAVNPWNVPGRSRRRRGGGVSVQVKVRGGRKLIRNAFIATLVGGQNAGKKGVFRRQGAARYPIRFLPSLSIPQMSAQRAVAAALLKVAAARFDANLRHELRFIARSGR